MRSSHSSAVLETALTSFFSEWSPGRTTISRWCAGPGMPNGSDSPWITSVGTVTPFSSSMRDFSGLPGGCTGNARHSTATACPSADVRHATLAPDERPPNTSGRSWNHASDSSSTTASHAVSSCFAGAGARRPATR